MASGAGSEDGEDEPNKSKKKFSKKSEWRSFK